MAQSGTFGPTKGTHEKTKGVPYALKKSSLLLVLCSAKLSQKHTRPLNIQDLQID